jgi:uncharacterized protein (TIGR00369 family)
MTFSRADAEALLKEAFAPWVQELGVRFDSVSPAGVRLVMPLSPRLHRTGGTVCGQALMALADTAMVFAIAAASGGMRPMTTVSQTSHFMRAIAGADTVADARLLRLGRTMAFGEVMLSAAGSADPAVHVSSSYALLGEAPRQTPAAS